MALLLSIETATPACSVALHEDGKLLASSDLHIGQTAGSKLSTLIDHVMQTCQITPNQIDAVAISSGPGSYTGLRIGVATTKGLCYALNIPLISINTLALMAFHVKEKILFHTKWQRSESVLLCPMLDARRMEVYAMLFDETLHEVKSTEAKVIDEQSFESELKRGPVFFFGSGSDKCRTIINHSNAHFIHDIVPSAKDMGELAYLKWQLEQVENLVTFEPFYLKDFMIRKPKEA